MYNFLLIIIIIIIIIFFFFLFLYQVQIRRIVASLSLVWERSWNSLYYLDYSVERQWCEVRRESISTTYSSSSPYWNFLFSSFFFFFFFFFFPFCFPFRMSRTGLIMYNTSHTCNNDSHFLHLITLFHLFSLPF